MHVIKMVTGYEADFYRQFAQSTKTLERLAYATEGLVVKIDAMLKVLERLVKLKESESVAKDLLD